MEQENDYVDHDHQSYRSRATSLNFNVPFLSTRFLHHSNSINEALSCSSIRRRNSTSVNDRVPFSWEKAPGKPKDDEDYKNEVSYGLCDTPRPKLPPSLLWHFRHNKNDVENENSYSDYYDNCDADVEVELEEGEEKVSVFNDRSDDVYSDAIDVFSLSEAIDIVERSEKRAREFTTDKLKLKIIEDSRNGINNQYPDFIIQRFLPDATALAAASTLGAMSLKKSCESYYSNNNIADDRSFNHQQRRRSHHRKTSTFGGRPSSMTRTTSFSSSKGGGCGLDMLFPWKQVKHKWPMCGVKSPVRHSSSFSINKSNNNNNNSMQLKHKKR